MSPFLCIQCGKKGVFAMRRRGWILVVLLLIVYFAAPFLGRQQTVSVPPAGPSYTPAPLPTAAPESQPYRAVWVSYLEWQQVDFSSPQSFTADISAMLDNIAALGATVVLTQVRPFGDALYPSDYYPFSHLCTGVQGQDPGFDPLALLVQTAHARGLQLEAWINPYRLQSGNFPLLCAQSPALTHPEWTKATANGLYLDPANAEVRTFIVNAVAELCRNYALDGIHFDDYFYPTTDPAFDADDYAAAGTTLSLDDWRRENVNALMALCWQTAHQYGVRFGVAPVGDPDRSYAEQYSDAALWLAQGGYVDYLMPQLYWGQSYTKNGSAVQSLGQLAAHWAALPRAEGVSLAIGLGAYRMGDGDGSDTPGEWTTGHALADQLAALRTLGIDGCGLYRYDSLFNNTSYPALAAAERENLAQFWQN